ncbi:hypothetical protein CA13_09100 [Planctomycetes bacterium CA13]|uniref:Uncharacterized protein n=1 Tax=Novipirellula herctigrandis TaxID=2527986 RepID=A0A5C5YY68_9BACT|nr:hypothetical protein CA13_09100 [Planctomycetes bacterium CA13]
MTPRLLSIIALLAFISFATNTPAEDSVPDFVANKSVVVARIGDSNAFTAYSKQIGEWTTHKFPDGIRATPVSGSHLIAFALEGDSIAELVAVDANGNWQTHKLSDENAKKCTPYVGANLAIYRIGFATWGFSGATRSWDSIKTGAAPSLSEDSAMILEPGYIHMFSELSGKWSSSPDLSTKKQASE